MGPARGMVEQSRGLVAKLRLNLQRKSNVKGRIVQSERGYQKLALELVIHG